MQIVARNSWKSVYSVFPSMHRGSSLALEISSVHTYAVFKEENRKSWVQAVFLAHIWAHFFGWDTKCHIPDLHCLPACVLLGCCVKCCFSFCCYPGERNNPLNVCVYGKKVLIPFFSLKPEPLETALDWNAKVLLDKHMIAFGLNCKNYYFFKGYMPMPIQMPRIAYKTWVPLLLHVKWSEWLVQGYPEASC